MFRKIRTNCGQAVEFPPPDESGRTMRDRASDDDEIRQVCRPPLCKVVGFLAKAVGPAATPGNGIDLIYLSRALEEFRNSVWCMCLGKVPHARMVQEEQGVRSSEQESGIRPIPQLCLNTGGMRKERNEYSFVGLTYKKALQWDHKTINPTPCTGDPFRFKIAQILNETT